MAKMEQTQRAPRVRRPLVSLRDADQPFVPRRLALVTDAWHPQTNGVVNTLSRLAKHLEATGTDVLVLAPDTHRTVPLPSYAEIRLAWNPWKAVERLRAFDADAVHVATEGPIGFWINHFLRTRGLRFS
ncbi:MAG TPA: glycosyltransferase, partial [Polyangia bacterium]|nr:glycosyltransferase [Polyangia bacterium]